MDKAGFGIFGLIFVGAILVGAYTAHISLGQVVAQILCPASPQGDPACRK